MEVLIIDHDSDDCTIIMYSGHNDEQEKLIYRKLGANGYLNKIGSIDKLKVELQTAIQN